MLPEHPDDAKYRKCLLCASCGKYLLGSCNASLDIQDNVWQVLWWMWLQDQSLKDRYGAKLWRDGSFTDETLVDVGRL